MRLGMDARILIMVGRLRQMGRRLGVVMDRDLGRHRLRLLEGQRRLVSVLGPLLLLLLHYSCEVGSSLEGAEVVAGR